MRTLSVALLASFMLTASADAGICRTIKWRSMGQIKCNKVRSGDGPVYVLKYGPGALSIVEARGERANLIGSLCDAGAVSVREQNGSRTYVHECNSYLAVETE